jgi:Protein of unknown function (DUF3000)
LRNLGPNSAEPDGAAQVPAVFDRALAGLATVELRPELDREQLPAPRRLASFSYAGSVAVLGGSTPGSGPGSGPNGGEPEEIGSGRFVLLYEPDGLPEWQGVFRCVTLIQVDLETEIAEDRLLPEVAWSWLTEAFGLRDARFAALGGTVSQCASTRFGDLAQNPQPGQHLAVGGGGAARGAQATGTQSTGDWSGAPEPIEHSLELRASWTPLVQTDPSGRAVSAEDAFTAIPAHFRAWTDLLAAAAGLPPVLAGVSSLPGGPRR